MKADKIVLLLVVVVMLASLAGTYFLFMQQDALSGKKIAAIQAAVDKVSSALNKVDSKFSELQVQSKGYADSIKGLEEKVSAADAERLDVNSKVADLMRSVEELKNPGNVMSMAQMPLATTDEPESTPAAEETLSTEPSAVDLGQIPVEK